LILDIKLLKNLWYDIVWKGLKIKESIEEITDLYFIHLGTKYPYCSENIEECVLQEFVSLISPLQPDNTFVSNPYLSSSFLLYTTDFTNHRTLGFLGANPFLPLLT